MFDSSCCAFCSLLRERKPHKIQKKYQPGDAFVPPNITTVLVRVSGWHLDGCKNNIFEHSWETCEKNTIWKVRPLILPRDHHAVEAKTDLFRRTTTKEVTLITAWSSDNPKNVSKGVLSLQGGASCPLSSRRKRRAWVVNQCSPEDCDGTREFAPICLQIASKWLSLARIGILDQPWTVNMLVRSVTK